MSESPNLLDLRRRFNASEETSAAADRSDTSMRSLRLAAVAAMSSPPEPDTARSISGRLGARIVVAEGVVSGQMGPRGTSEPSLGGFGDVEVPIGERTALLVPPSPGGLSAVSIDVGGGDGSPPLAMWIFPALSCAAAYAFYNVSVHVM